MNFSALTNMTILMRQLIQIFCHVFQSVATKYENKMIVIYYFNLVKYADQKYVETMGFHLGRCGHQEIHLASQPCPGGEEVLFEDRAQRKGTDDWPQRKLVLCPFSKILLKKDLLLLLLGFRLHSP